MGDNTGRNQARKGSKKRRQQPQVDYSGAYFKHTNFERAVIATNGRAPYNNKEVEMITKPEGFDPNSKAFKNNWVNNLMRSGNKKSPRMHASNVTANQDNIGMHTPGQLSGVPSASVTATTVFQGLNANERESINDSAMRKHLKEGSMTGMDRRLTPASGSFQAQMNNLVNESPVTMMDMSDDKNRLGAAGGSIV